MVSAGWWPTAAPQQRRHAIAGRVLALPDGTWWLYGAWRRWYRWHPSDGQWYLCPPPMSKATRQTAMPVQQGGSVPDLPPHVVPAGPDFGYAAPRPMPFVGHDLAKALTTRVRSTIEAAAALPVQDYPHWWATFSSSVPSTVALSWGVMLWCAVAPVFDSRFDDHMLGLWSPYRAKPLATVDGPRWLTPPPLEALVGLYSERLRSGNVEAAVVVLRTMWAVASALREDPRFQARADALIAVVGATLNNPSVDYGALNYGDQALVQQWVTRCPPSLQPALRIESSPGDNFRHAYYDLARAVTRVAGNPADPSYLEPRLVAATLIAADLARLRQDVVGMVVPWLDPEIRYTVQAVLSQNGHPLRRLWPVDDRLPEPLRANLGDNAELLLATSYAADLAWCRLAGGMPARPKGFPVPTAIIAEIIGVGRARAAAVAEPVAPPPPAAPPLLAPAGLNQPGVAPRQPGLGGLGLPGGLPPNPLQGQPAWGPQAQEPAAFGLQGPPQVGQNPAGVPDPVPHQPPAPLNPAQPIEPPAAFEPAADDNDFAVPYTQLGFARADQQPQRQQEAWSPPPMEPVDPMATRLDGPREDSPRTRVLGGGGPVPARPAGEAAAPGTQIMSETMVGGFLEAAPLPEQPLSPPPPAAARPIAERFGVRFVCGPDADAGEFLDGVRDGVRDDGDPEATLVDGGGPSGAAPDLLLVGAPHSGERRLARMIALALAEAGVSDGTLKMAEAVRGAPAEELGAVLESAGATALLFERLDVAVLESGDPQGAAAAVLAQRRARFVPNALIATCDPRALRRLERDHPGLMAGFRVFRLPDLGEAETRMTVLHVLADERRTTLDPAALEVAGVDLARLRGPGELVNARLVETYLDRACQRNIARAGASRDRLVLTPEDFQGVAAELEPALRPAGDVDGFLGRLDEMVGLDGVKTAVHALVDEAEQGILRHLVLAGPPGTGKTTVAHLIGGIYAALGLLGSGHVVVCRPVHLAGRDDVDTESRVYGMVEQAMGGVLLIQEAHRLARTPAVVTELLAAMAERRGRFLVICAGPSDAFLGQSPDFSAVFGHVVEFEPPTARELVQLFQRFAERNVYTLDEELRVELMHRFAQMREDEGFGYARTVRELFEQSVARQAARLAGEQVNAATVARLSARDLPPSPLERMLGDFHRQNGT
ncbi:MAG: ATPase [Actinomycetia bacterium]|nr:ATPase [Actinomycetes bacterium]